MRKDGGMSGGTTIVVRALRNWELAYKGEETKTKENSKREEKFKKKQERF
jgi:hypothetical protein